MSFPTISRKKKNRKKIEKKFIKTFPNEFARKSRRKAKKRVRFRGAKDDDLVGVVFLHQEEERREFHFVGYETVLLQTRLHNVDSEGGK